MRWFRDSLRRATPKGQDPSSSAQHRIKDPSYIGPSLRSGHTLTPHRVDFFYTPAGKILVNEINTMPGMTPASGFPMMWAASGLPLPQLIDRIITSALRKAGGPR